MSTYKVTVEGVALPGPVEVKSKPWYLGWLFGHNEGVTIGGVVYLNDLGSQEILSHEFKHVWQQRNYPGGPTKWLLRYLSDGSFRRGQEFEAYCVQCQCLRFKYGPQSIQYAQMKAVTMSMTGYSAAQVKTALDALWAAFPSKPCVAYSVVGG